MRGEGVRKGGRGGPWPGGRAFLRAKGLRSALVIYFAEHRGDQEWSPSHVMGRMS